MPWSIPLALAGLLLTAGPDFDPLIRGGRIADGTGNPYFHHAEEDMRYALRRRLPAV